MITASELNARPEIKHGFFTRQGGVSDGLYHGLNCGYGSGDEAPLVDENRTRAMAMLGVCREDLNTVYQIHSPLAVIAEKPWSLDERPKADAIVTRQAGLAIGILTADCTPVLFADTSKGVIGAAHAGWKGAIGGVLASTVQAMESLGANRAHIIAAVGPCIHQESYEVGPEFRATFLEADGGNERFFIPSETVDHHLFDLPGYVLDALSKLGLKTVQNVSVDTYTDEDRFFSYRRATHREEADYGRGLSAIVLSQD